MAFGWDEPSTNISQTSNYTEIVEEEESENSEAAFCEKEKSCCGRKAEACTRLEPCCMANEPIEWDEEWKRMDEASEYKK